MSKIICPVTCANYTKGGFGERCCTIGQWDERSQHNKPRLDENYSVIKPASCFVDRGPRRNTYVYKPFNCVCKVKED